MYEPRTSYSQPGIDQMFPRLSEPMLNQLATYGAELAVPADGILFERGARGVALYIVLNGELEIREKQAGRLFSVIARLAEGQFTGEMDLLSTRETLLDCVSVRPTRVLCIHREQLRRLMRAESEIAEIITIACVKRRNELLQEATGGVLLIGKRTCGPTMLLQRFLLRNSYPHRLLDLTFDAEASDLFEGLGLSIEQLPVAVLPDGRILHHPNIITVADNLGLNEPADVKDIYDVAVVGAGPSGLAAAVYAASEGLTTIAIEGNAPGGQAGTSSKIENYLGFPTGISGQELAERAQIQAQKFGARLAVSRNVTGLCKSENVFHLVLEDGTGFAARAVVIATGARYRKLDLPNYEFYETQGVHYAATPMEAAICMDEEVVVVGGGNSAGQAAVFLSQAANHVHLLIRGDNLASTMSDYLIQRIAHSPKITVHANSAIIRLSGDSILREVTWETRGAEGCTTRQIRNVFVMIGANPNTEWLKGIVELDAAGFVQTDSTRGSVYATTLSGLFAVGDVRAGSTKRVASAVGEGSAAIAAVHAYLSQQGERTPMRAYSSASGISSVASAAAR